MLDLIKRLDFWLTLGALLFAGMLEYDRIRAWWRARAVKGLDKGDGAVMSRGGGSESNVDGMEPPIPPSVLSRPDAVNTGTWEPVPESLSRSALLDILARQKIDNKYVFSGNKLIELLASTPHAASRNELLREIAAIRDTGEPPPKPASRLERPANGW